MEEGESEKVGVTFFGGGGSRIEDSVGAGSSTFILCVHCAALLRAREGRGNERG